MINQLKTTFKYFKYPIKRLSITNRIIKRLSNIEYNHLDENSRLILALGISRMALFLDSTTSLNRSINVRQSGFYQAINDFLSLGKKCHCGNDSRIGKCDFDFEINNCINYCNCCETCSEKCSNDI